MMAITNNVIMKITTATTAMMMIIVVDIPVLVEVGLGSVVVEVVFVALEYSIIPTVKLKY